MSGTGAHARLGAPPLVVDEDTRRELQRISRSRSRSRRARLQARVLLLAVDGVPNAEIARRCHLTDDTVRAWRKQFTANGLTWIGRIAPGRGRKPSVSPATERAVVRATLRSRAGAPCQIAGRLSTRFGISLDVVRRIWRDFGVLPPP